MLIHCQSTVCLCMSLAVSCLQGIHSSHYTDWPDILGPWGRHWPRKGVCGDVRPWRPPFHASPVVRKGPNSSKRVSSQDLLRKFWNFSIYSLNFHPNFSSQAPKFGSFQLTSPQIWKFSVHKPPFSETNISSQPPHFRNPGRTPPGGYLVERWVRGCAAQIGAFSISQVFQWPLFYLKIGLDIGRIFAKCIIFVEFFL